MTRGPVNHRSGYTEKTAKKLWVDSGVAYKNISYNSQDDSFEGELIGATSGGVGFNIELTLRQIEIDGASHVQTKDLKVVEEANGTLTVPLKELSAQAFIDSIKGSARDPKENEAPAGYKVIETVRDITSDMYVENVGIVGRQPGNDKPIIIILDNALVSEGVELDTEDNSEAIMEQVWQAHATYEQLQAGVYPWRVLYPPEPSDDEGNDNGNGEAEAQTVKTAVAKLDEGVNNK